MSCWVVPAVAAEYLRISIEDLLLKIQEGSISSKTDHGFVMVDVAPDSPRVECHVHPDAGRQPLHDEPVNQMVTIDLDLDEAVSEPVAELTGAMGDFRLARKAIGRQRRRPILAA